MVVTLFHRTTANAAQAILSSGFKDGTGKYLAKNEYSGVWLSDVPLTLNEGADGDTLLEVNLDLPKDELQDYEWVEDGKPYREWLIPAELINTRASIRIKDEE